MWPFIETNAAAMSTLSDRGTSIIGGDIGAGILQHDELATARQGDRMVERSFPARDRPSRCSLIFLAGATSDNLESVIRQRPLQRLE
jgi:hypothetical protein